jgi:multiple sugar transport system substrate-binding protein
MNKKFIGILMTTAMLTTSFTGCGTDNIASGINQTQKDEDMKGKTEVDFWYSGGKTAVKVVQDIVDDYNKSQDTYFVKTVTQADYSETYEKLQAAIAGNVAPDVVLLESDSARGLSDKNLVVDLSEKMKKDNDFNEDDYVSTFFEQGKDDNDKMFGIPAYGTTQVLYYNKNAFNKAGIDPNNIKTWQDLAQAASKIKNDGEYTYGWEPMWGADNLIDASLSNGGTIFSEDGKKVTINSKEWVEVWSNFEKWIHDDKTMAIHSGGQGWEYWYKTIDDVIQNKAGGYTGSSGDQADLDFSIVGAIEQPSWKDGTESKPVARALMLSVLTKSSEEKQAGAYDFMKYFTNVKSQAKWSMSTGYVPVNKGVLDDDDYMKYTQENPQALVPYTQAEHGSIYPYDPTNGAVKDALRIAADKVEIDGSSAKDALDEAQKTAQKALDEALEK